MCISLTVGKGRPNKYEDAKTVQILLNMNSARMAPFAHLEEDGIPGRDTYNAIARFQQTTTKLKKPDGCVDPGGTTLKELRNGIPRDFTELHLRGVMIRTKNSDLTKFFGPLKNKMTEYHIDTPLRQAHFLAQIAHESGGLRYTQEIADGEAYEGRDDLGNDEVGDGPKFKGRGLIQLTGKSNYKKYGDAKKTSYLDGDEYRRIASDPTLAVDVACWFWSTKNLNTFADLDDVNTIAHKINGGYNGLDDRKKYLKRAKFFLMHDAG